MERHIQSATGPQAGSPQRSPETGRRKPGLPVFLAVLVLAPGVLLAAPLRQAFSQFMVTASDSKTTPSFEQVLDEGRARRHAQSRRPVSGVAGAGGRAALARSVVATAQPGRDGLLRLADFETGVAGGSDAAAATLSGDDGEDALMASAQAQSLDDTTSGPAVIGGGARGAGSGGGFGGFGGGGGAAGAQAGTPPGGADPAGSALGPDSPAGHLPQLGNGLGALSAAPEPAAWVSLILGFGLTGAVLRRRRSEAPGASQR
ncbi:MAG: PEPxxWA-CTERM sorting domain-containing protein [Phenylobacterium sp.]